MNRRLIAAATLVLVAGVAVVVFGSVNRRTHPAPPVASISEHGAGMDHAMGAFVALYHAPEGSTPCESAYNAFKYSLDVSTQKQLTPVVLKLAPRDQFLATCGSLPAPTQQCLVPLYLSEHRDACQKAKPPQDVLDSLVQMKHAAEPGSQGESQEPPEPPPVAAH
ncbi:MAG TPA: hypothetical protein VMI75_21225 [Polyangiaceae bacterium]|nr:hypothetical protein [Polyangiaceae bacterium]